MAQTAEIDSAKQLKNKVELHVHLDGAVRLSTIWELAKKKGVKLEAKNVEELYDACRVKRPSSLKDFLKAFDIICPIISGDLEVIERIAYEFCEDVAKQGVLYCEVRYSPQLLASPTVTPRDVMTSLTRGFSRGSADFKVTVKSILCCFRSRPEWSNEVLDLCVEFKNQGVVGMDVAGDEAQGLCASSDIEVFKRAASLGIHRTAHAGEAGPASNVDTAITKLLVERIGHGYHIIDDNDLYLKAKQSGVHFEVCPYSSILTGAVPAGCPKHPIVKFAEDNVNFSISRDDPTIIQKSLDEEYDFLRSLGLQDSHIIKANFNAARNCFLPDDEKEILIEQLRKIYGNEPSTSASIKLPSIKIKTLEAGDI